MRQLRGNRWSVVGRLPIDDRQKRERGSETIYVENARVWTSSLVGDKEVLGGLKTKQKQPIGVYTVHTCTCIVLTF